MALLTLAGLLALLLCFKSDVEWHSLRNYPLVAGRYSVPYLLFLLSIASLGVCICLAFLHPSSKAGHGWKLVSVYTAITLYCMFLTVAAFEFILQRNPMWIVTPQATLNPMQIVLFSFDQWQADPDIGVLGRPNASAKNVQGPFALYSLYDRSAWRDEKRPAITFNTDAQGFRNDAVVQAPDIIATGDSFTHGAFVNREEIWLTQLAQHFGATERNLGLSAFSPQQSGLVLQRFGLPQSPKVVIFQLYYGNDFDDAVQFERWKQSGKTYVQFIRGQLGEMPQLVMAQRWFHNRFMPQDKQAGPRWQPVQCQLEDARIALGFAPPSPILYQEREQIRSHPGFASTINAIETMQRECRSNGAHFLVCAVPAKISVYMDAIAGPQNQRRLMEQQAPGRELAFELARSRIDNLPDVVQEEMMARNIQFVDLTLPLRKNAIENGALLYYPFDTHWNPDGHKAASKILSEQIQRLGWLK